MELGGMPPEPPRPLSPVDDDGDDGMTPPSPERDGYRLLDAAGRAEDGALPVPDGLSSDDDASDADAADDDDEPQSVADLMAALERHGVNTVETTDDPAGDLPDPCADLVSEGAPAAAAPRTKESDPSQWPEEAMEAERQRQKQAAQERLALFSTPPRSGRSDGPLGADQAEAVRRAMRSVRLPGAERWASGLSDQQWRRELDRVLGRTDGDGAAACGEGEGTGEGREDERGS
ncbi:uncharacterized protein LOC122365034 isoform X1 [Amphibalanus amphitrite]|uniref:uncharacterized protein LOC122365034 isoform X1 n=2 Tax=Amphibalanus amphitrite TaxID=1232801 RepID=UPI001C905773|nr:uncharacterized protein LOC122365034 isoform X1 [Amphibalanus amphitrite]